MPTIADVETPADGYAWDIGPDPEETDSGRAHIPWRERRRAERERRAAEPILNPGEQRQRHTWTIFIGLLLPVALIVVGLAFLLAPEPSEEPSDTALPPAATLPPGETAPATAPPVTAAPAAGASAPSSAPGPAFTDPQKEALTLATQLANALAQHDFDAARSVSAEPKEDGFYADRYPFAAGTAKVQVSMVPVQVTPAGPNLFAVRALLRARAVASGATTFICTEWVVDAGSGKITDQGAVPLKGTSAAQAPAACVAADLG
jgi:hypothetical protein